MFQRDIGGTHILVRRRHQGGHVTLKKQKKMGICFLLCVSPTEKEKDGPMHGE